jgi:hypothetical protein
MNETFRPNVSRKKITEFAMSQSGSQGYLKYLNK